ncbi:uncharacterized protein magl isoform X2 [Amphiprion ocellaris]|uniref:uncharacterized protein magl isoform X2 n=1 Tax=Amphiprion ocellaris TaxID=80972 RepID=UPI002410E218|nr:uncharacterized protein magl isoform X2 [Amphiprion ocellaris]
MSDSELASMEGSLVTEDELGSFSIPSSAPSFPATVRPNFSSDAEIESKAVSVASNDCSSALSSPTEASPAKPAATSTSESSPATSCIASASDSLTCSGTSLASESWVSSVPSTTFGTADLENDLPAVLTFKGISVTLENNSVWKQFYGCGTEMILTKPGRRMFPYCRYRLAGLDPDQQYNLVLSIVPSGQYRYRWSTSKWEIHGPPEHQGQGLIRAFSHHYSPCRGSEWMSSLVSFYKLKLTNNSQDQDGHIILHSMHRYIPRLHVIPVLDGNQPTADKPVVMGPESITFTFPQTEFMAVTTYQNFRITQLKINHNPFAKGFREDGHNPRLQRVSTEAQPVVKTEPQESDLKPAAEPKEDQQEAVDLSTKNPSVSASPSNAPETTTRLVLKPIMSNAAGRDEPFVPCIRGHHALGELVLVQKREEPKEEPVATSVTPEAQRGLTIWTLPKARLSTPAFSTSTPGSSPGYRKRRKRINRRWANPRGREWKAAAASPTVAHSPSSTVAMQPELDDVEGLLFVSFTSKEALEGHVRDKSTSSPASPVSLTTPKESKQTSEKLEVEVEVEVSPETDEEKIARLEAILLNDLRLLKHRQVIHPVLQEVGLKLSSLDPSKSIDLQYLGVLLPLPFPSLPEQNNTAAPSPGDEGLTFISRTGKTSDVTKIKGWKNKFIRSKETSPSNSEALQKNLSAFCSNMLDEYLENEAQQISERAAAFSTDPEGSVAYQLPAKSSSYVKTLDSVLKQQNAASRLPVRAIRPCPLSHKPLLYSALTSPPPLLTSPETPKEAEAESQPQTASSDTQPAAASGSSCTAEVSQGSPVLSSRYVQKPAMSFGVSHSTNHKSSGLTKCQLKLLKMEMRAMKEGVGRTQLTADRLSMALSVMLTKQMTTCQVLKVVPFPNTKPAGPECGQAFCRLGCVCSSLRHPFRGPLHCRRPECMFDCVCFKHQITKQATGSEPQTNLVNCSQVRKLWNRKVHSEDPEPLYSPTSSPLCAAQMKVPKRIVPARPAPPISEEEKDPVYKYLESMMTCARVRAFNSKPPPEVSLELKIPADVTTTITTITTAATAGSAATGAAPPNTAAEPQNSADNPQKSSLTSVKKAGTPAEKTSQETSNTSGESEAKKQIQIQSACQWKKDRTMVLEALCERMNQNQLSQRFYIGPYCISPVAKIFMKKPSGSIVTYRVLISKPSKASDYDEDELDDSDQSSDEDMDPEEEDEQIDEPRIRFGVTPFLSGVIPAGRLRARRKPAGCQAQGLIQVNGKSYNHARLLLGNMGSLHPANRLAAYVTGRLHTSGDSSHKNSQKPNSSQRNDLPGAPHVKAAGSIVPPRITARKTTDLKITVQPPVQSLQQDFWKKASVSLLPPSQNSCSIKPVQSFVPSSTSSPVFLTVSPALKSPSFLGQSGTYSFRICPPSNQGSGGQTLPGVILPGGFTLIQLPKPGAGGADSQQSEPQSATNTANAGDVPPQKEGAVNFSRLAAELIGLDTREKVRRLLSSKTVESGSSEPVCEEKKASDESDEANGRKAIKQEESSIDIVSEDFSSDSSDCSGDEDDRLVDIETVDERAATNIAKMRASLQESRDSSDGFGSVREVTVQDEHEDSINRRKRKHHSVLEKQRRSELRFLYDKLQIILQSDPCAPRLQLLSLANKEIQLLVKTSKCLEERKEMLTKMQTDYIKMLSTLTGKSESQIKDKLKRICERQKRREKSMKLKPFFSQLLQSRAAYLQANPPPLHLPTTPLILPNNMPSLQANQLQAILTPPNRPMSSVDHTGPMSSVDYTRPMSSVDHNVQQMLALLQPIQPKPQARPFLRPRPHFTPSAAPSPAQSEVKTPQKGGPVASTQISQHRIPLESKQKGKKGPDKVTEPPTKPQAEPQSGPKAASVNATPLVPVAQHGSSAPLGINSKVQLPQPLPLFCTKDGRIILPSSLKPLGNGFYTLMVMTAKQDGDAGTVNSPAVIQPPDVNSSKNQEKTSSTSDKPPDSETSRVSEDKTASSDPKCSVAPKSSLVAAHPLAKLANLSKSIFVPLVDLKVAAKRREAAARLSSYQVNQVSSPAESKPDPSANVVRHRGRPRKTRLNPGDDSETSSVVEKAKDSVDEEKISMQVEEKQSEELKKKAEAVVGEAVELVKRGRGRPPKNKPAQLQSPKAAVKRAASSSSKSSDYSPEKRFKSLDAKAKKSPASTSPPEDVNGSRPLTRGALGKDFPSAKKRSWIDIEKELDPDIESE